MAKPEDELADISIRACPSACTASRCVISQDGCCVHPAKSGLQAKHQVDPATLARFARAKTILDHQRVERQAAEKPHLTGRPHMTTPR